MNQKYYIYLLKICFEGDGNSEKLRKYEYGYYVGETSNLTKRISDHLRKNSKSTHLINMATDIKEISVEMIYEIDFSVFSLKINEDNKKSIADQFENFVVCDLFKNYTENQPELVDYTIEESDYCYAGGFLTGDWYDNKSSEEIDNHIEKTKQNETWKIKVAGKIIPISLDDYLRPIDSKRFVKLKNLSTDEFIKIKKDFENKKKSSLSNSDVVEMLTDLT
ncbi:hypothetical protein GHU05_02460 [Fructobacillus tropaeoli]|uniref:GIY-YIG nuclease family protein n=1 Tax=Fructobacillus tropaeoli TaxID=709323 RepID=UPI001455FC86|nr:GIY-YIG nuclease family protein [Fructobacillus tropaeoli]NLS37796.1 hypothetical protein [Fructobacillus tropaeoli]